jgi:hypothetical protein
LQLFAEESGPIGEAIALTKGAAPVVARNRPAAGRGNILSRYRAIHGITASGRPIAHSASATIGA